MSVAKRSKHCHLARVSKRNSTIDDVAKAAGVARVTVSRVLNNGQNVRAATRERVQRAVEALGYSVNQQARALASGSGRQIMLIHAHNPEREPNSYYHAGLELGALRACSSLGYDLITLAIDPDGDNPSRLLAAIVERERPAGIILSPPLCDDLELLASARRAGVRIVAISAGERARVSPGGARNPVGDVGHRLRRHADVGNRLATAHDRPAADQIFRRTRGPFAVRGTGERGDAVRSGGA